MQENRHNNRKKTFFTAEQQDLRQQLRQVMRKDRIFLNQRIRGLARIKNSDVRQRVALDIRQLIEQAQDRLQQRRQTLQKLTIQYPDLPVSQQRNEILHAIKHHQVIIVAGETGSGKTTQLPKMCLELGRGQTGLIGHTQPRRIAARSVAMRIAQELESPLGETVGFKVRFRDQVGENSAIKLMTDGILLAEIQQDRFLNQYDTIIIDEAHERSLNNDFLLGYLKQLLPKRPDLKLIITSATIDVERFSQHFNQAPIIEVSGRTYPVEVRYRPIVEQDGDQLQAIFDAINELHGEKRGDILIFLNGEREIRDTTEALQKQNYPLTEILPLYARLSAQEQNKIFHLSGGNNRIILATNVAETSLTVPGIKYVIDPGTARISRYSYRTKVQRLPIEPISQASANQRKGRCGRVQSGICIRLYSEEDFLNRPQFTDPEILRTNLASVILQMTALGLEHIEHFPFIDAPDRRHIQDGIRLLEELEAFQSVKTPQGDKRILTETGKNLAKLPVDPRLAKMLLTASQLGCLREVMVIVAALSIQDPRERPLNKQQAADEKHRRFVDKKSDFSAFLNLWQYIKTQQETLTHNQFRRLCQKEYLNYLRVREWQELYHQIRLTVRELGFSINTQDAKALSIHTALLSGLLSHIGQYLPEKQRYLGARNAHFSLFPNSILFKKPPKWVMAAELVETSKLWGRLVAEIQPEWIEPLAQHLLRRSYSEPHWSKSQGAVMAYEKITLYGIPIVSHRLIHYGKIDPIISRNIFIQSALVEGNWQTRHSFFHQNLKLIREVENLEHKTRRRDILVDEQQLFEFYDQRIPHSIVSQRHFDHWWNQAKKTQAELLNFEKSFLINEKANKISTVDFPNFWVQGDLKLKLIYQFEPGKDEDGITVQIPLPLLNQVEDRGFEWLIPGLRQELIVTLIKSLPKSLRRHFVPTPDYAQAFLERVTDIHTPLYDSLSTQLYRMSGVKVDPTLWQQTNMPHHLCIRFQVIDENNKILAENGSLNELKHQLKHAVQHSLSNIVDEDIEQTGIHIWNFNQLPQIYEQKKQHFSIKAYPAIIDEGNSVGIKLFETEAEQHQAMSQGLRRLLLLNIPSPIRYLHEKLPNKTKLGLYFAPFGRVLGLIDDCIVAAVDQIIQQQGGFVWNEEDFELLKEQVRMEINPITVAIAKKVEDILTLAYQLNQRLKKPMDLNTAFAYTDIKHQLESLIYPNFVQQSGFQRLSDILRYLQAINKRIDKLNQNINQDRALMLRIELVQKAYQAYLNRLPKSQPIPQHVKEVRYMIEEFRVSLFAQQLGTPYPISDKRILAVIDKL